MGKPVDLTGLRFGRLVVLHETRVNGRKRWVCSCDCGGITTTCGQHLVSGHTKSCGCLQRDRTSEACGKDYTGARFGRLFVVEKVSNAGGSALYRCVCDCGTVAEVNGSNLVSGATRSCGCIRKEAAAKLKFSHGEHGTRIYRCWRNMLERCENPKCNEYPHYGRRGISVCEEWHDPVLFFKWAKESGYRDDLSIDRIDVNGDYCPDNCRWADNATQARNKTNNVKITFAGRTMILADWAQETGLSAKSITYRLRHGWSVEDALTKPASK